MKTLIKWKNNDSKKALIVEGSRHVGKTYIIRQFAKENYENIIEIKIVF